MVSAIVLLNFALPVLLIVGACGLLKWKAWGRKLLVVWSALTIVLGLATSTYFLARDWGTSQPGRFAAMNMWLTFTGWLDGCALPLAFLGMMIQPEVKRLWAPSCGGSAFEVIPTADVARAATAAPAPEVVP